ncbi:MAG: 50S ribosomal protein L24 [Candidatus Pacearchaeota archaeon]|nr:50S ribosomal protein L24 [Candidatus Pacearchaeota archaeon]
MKEFSPKWKKSKSKRKHRKYLAKAHLKLRHKMMSVNLSKELRKQFGRRSIEPRKGDVVRIMRGEFKKKEGKIVRLDFKKYKIYIEGVQKTKKDGTKVNVPIHPSNLQIKELNLEDAKRLQNAHKKINHSQDMASSKKS